MPEKLSLNKIMPAKEKESLQYITFLSLKQNFHKAFGQQNDAMAELLFKYLSGAKDEFAIETMRVNYFQFLQQLDVLWPKKQPEVEIKDKLRLARMKDEEQKKYKEATNKLAFSIFDRDGDGILSILDLSWCSKHFEHDTIFGQEIAVLINEYMDKNIRPKYVKEKEIINLSAFTHLIHKCSLIADLEYAFRDKFKPFDAEP